MHKVQLNILGVIPARGGSKEVPRKNLLKIGDKTLIDLAIASANESELLTRTIFSSDDEEMINLAKDSGCEVPFVRPESLASDTASTFSVMENAVEWLEDNENWEADILVILQPTTPFRRGHHIDSVINLLIESDSDAAITIRKPDYPPYWTLKMDNENRLGSLIVGGNLFKRRQETPESFQPAGLVYAFKKELLNNSNSLFPIGDTRGFLVSREESINIDSYIDYELARIINDKIKLGGNK